MQFLSKTWNFILAANTVQTITDRLEFMREKHKITARCHLLFYKTKVSATGGNDITIISPNNLHQLYTAGGSTFTV